jgi:hypothetical protein
MFFMLLHALHVFFWGKLLEATISIGRVGSNYSAVLPR